MLVTSMIALLRGDETADGALAVFNGYIGRTDPVDKERLVKAIEDSVRAHEEAGRTVAGGLFVQGPGSLSGLVGLHVFAVGSVPDDRLRRCYIAAELPDLELSPAAPMRDYDTDTLHRWELPLEISRALTARVKAAG